MEQSSAVTWTSVPITRIGYSDFEQAGTIEYDIPAVIPSSAKEVLVLAAVHVGNSGPNGCINYVKIYTQSEQNERYEKYIVLKSYKQEAWSTNSDNLWFPLTSGRKIFVELNEAHTGGNVNFTLHATGHR